MRKQLTQDALSCTVISWLNEILLVITFLGIACEWILLTSGSVSESPTGSLLCDSHVCYLGPQVVSGYYHICLRSCVTGNRTGTNMFARTSNAMLTLYLPCRQYQQTTINLNITPAEALDFVVCSERSSIPVRTYMM